MKTSVSSIGLRYSPKAQFLLALALVTPHSSAFAQGTLDFKNFGTPSLNAPVLLPDGVTRLGAGFTVVLLAGPTSNSLAQIDSRSFLTGTQTGYFDGGVETIPDVPGGTSAFVMVQFWQSKLILPPSPAQTLPPSYPWLWGFSPEFSVLLGDPLSQPPTSPGTLSGLGTAPLILAVPTLVVQQTDTNTLAFSWHVAPDRYALVAKYVLQQTSDLNQANWTTLTITNFLAFAVLPRPSATTFYRMTIE